MTETTDGTCFHCGETIPGDTELVLEIGGQMRAVCCSGCLAVARLIHHSGLENYYRFRQRLGSRIRPDVAARQEAWKTVDDRMSLWGTLRADGDRDLLLQTEGIRCAACAWLIRSHLERSRGVRAVQVDTATGFTRITWNPAQTRLSEIAAALFGLGYTPHLPIASEEEEGRRTVRHDSLKRVGVAGLGMMQGMMYAVGLYAGDALGISSAAKGFLTWVSLIVALPVLLYSGRPFFTGAWNGLRNSRPGMDLPVALAVALAFSASCVNFFRSQGEVWFDSVVMFIFFLSLGRHFELVLRHRNLQAGSALARLMPEWAQRLSHSGSETVPAADLALGDRVRVAIGEPFPADGALISGTTEVNEALLTGESQPRLRRQGDPVVAGTVNLSQPVEMEVTAAGNEATVSALGRLLLTAQARRPDAQGMPSWLVPVFIIAVLVAASGTWWYWHLAQPERAFPAMLAVLVASCPCALSLALPAVYSATCQRLMKAGILLTRADALHDLLRVDTVVFDKTGTLTRGYPEIQRVRLNTDRPEVDQEAVLRIAASLEAHSAHPLARAFSAGMGGAHARDVVVVPGSGLTGNVGGKIWRIGNPRFVLGDDAAGQGAVENGAIWLADEKGWCAVFELTDALRQGSRNAVRQLSSTGRDIHICSGDAEQPVAAIAGLLGIGSWQSRLGADEKLQVIRALQQEGCTVLMIGDGVNDGPVLAAADVSMTVKGAAELANSTADFILTTDSLAGVTQAFAIARQATRLVRQNLVWALVYNAGVMPLAMSGTLKPWMAALGMSLSSLLVVLNAARISRRADESSRHCALPGAQTQHS